jgi:hypothetical protein
VGWVHQLRAALVHRAIAMVPEPHPISFRKKEKNGRGDCNNKRMKPKVSVRFDCVLVTEREREENKLVRSSSGLQNAMGEKKRLEKLAPWKIKIKRFQLRGWDD